MATVPLRVVGDRAITPTTGEWVATGITCPANQLIILRARTATTDWWSVPIDSQELHETTVIDDPENNPRTYGLTLQNVAASGTNTWGRDAENQIFLWGDRQIRVIVYSLSVAGVELSDLAEALAARILPEATEATRGYYVRQSEDGETYELVADVPTAPDDDDPDELASGPRRVYSVLQDLQNIGVPIGGELNADRNWEATERATTMLRDHFRREFLPHRGVVTFDASRRRQLRLSSDIKLEIGGYAIAPVIYHRQTVWEQRAAYSGDHKWLPLDLPEGEVSCYGILQRDPDYGLLEVDCLMGAFVERGRPRAISGSSASTIDVARRAFGVGDSLVILTESPSTLADVEVAEIAAVDDSTDGVSRLTVHRGIAGTTALESPHQYLLVAPHPTIAGAAKQLANQLSAQGGIPAPSQDDYISGVDYPQIWRMIRNMRSGRQLARLGVPSRSLPVGAY